MAFKFPETLCGSDRRLKQKFSLFFLMQSSAMLMTMGHGLQMLSHVSKAGALFPNS
jgi:hypothetical protein